MYCNNNFEGKYGATVGPKLPKPPGESGLPRDNRSILSHMLAALSNHLLSGFD